MIAKLVRRAFWLSCLILMVLPLGAAIAAPSVVLEKLTWTELRDQIKAGKTTVLVPIGGTEQNGPHMALGKHNARVAALAERIALVLGNAIVAPVIAYVPEGGLAPPTAHMRFPGTITLPDQAFETMLQYAAKSFALHGFRDVVFLGDHGGYQGSMQRVADRLNREWASGPVRAHAVAEYYRASETTYVKALKERGYGDAEIGTHAGLADTSLTLALAPDLVRKDRIASTLPSAAQGVYGDPRRSSAELGELGVNAIVTQSVAAIQSAVTRR
jgi:creatinine amidohydrolase/Fe(II)-dependent formamide hydrolase-like protein